MNIDATFLPVAVELIQNVFPTGIVYHRSDGKAYDPVLGKVVETITDYSISVGLISRGRAEAGGRDYANLFITAETYELKFWVDHSATGLPHLPTTADTVTYDGVKWKVTVISPTYSSSNLIASKIIARNQ